MAWDPTSARHIADLLDLEERGADGLQDALALAQRGDWLTRAVGWSVVGRVARRETFGRRAVRWVARRMPGQWNRFPSAGHQGKYVRHFIATGLSDRVWAVRTAAALALGECGSPESVSALRNGLRARFRAERIASACAIRRCGGQVKGSPSDLLRGSIAVPGTLGLATGSTDVLAFLAGRHLDVLGAWDDPGSEGVSDRTPESWATLMAGPPATTSYAGLGAEIGRYSGADSAYLLAKPFTPISRPENIRLLSTFAAVAQQLHIPPRGRVLDLGAGSAWTSELLARLGYETVSLDVSTVLLALGQERFRRHGLAPRFVAAAMERLPIADSAMDAVVVIDALHHVPDMPAVFREAYRVLADGGCLVLAEPGEGHSETNKAHNEMLDYGIQEGEVHLLEAVSYGREAGFADVLVVPHHAPIITMSPERLLAALKATPDDWRVEHHGKAEPFVDFFFQSIFDNPVIVFRKGDPHAHGRLAAEISTALTRDGRSVRGEIAVLNVGASTWRAGSGVAGDVRVGAQLFNEDRQPLDKDFHRMQLPSDVAPGCAVVLPLSLELPEVTARYVLKIDLVVEGTNWFEDRGSAPEYVAV